MEVKHKTNSSGMVNGCFMSSLNVENSLYDLSNEDEFYLYEVNHPFYLCFYTYQHIFQQ